MLSSNQMTKQVIIKQSRRHPIMWKQTIARLYDSISGSYSWYRIL